MPIQCGFLGKKIQQEAGFEGGCYCNELKISAMTTYYQRFLIL